jgi:hypothetical protein
VLELTGAAKLGLQSNESNSQSPAAHVSLTMKRLPSKSTKQKGEEDALETAELISVHRGKINLQKKTKISRETCKA